MRGVRNGMLLAGLLWCGMWVGYAAAAPNFVKVAEMYMAAASLDEYQPPPDGKLTRQQIDRFLRDTVAAEALMAKYREYWRTQLAREKRRNLVLAGGAAPWAPAWHQRMTMVSICVDHAHLPSHWLTAPDEQHRASAARQNGARLALVRAVKSSGGNWAEHRWVESRLRQVQATMTMGALQRDATGLHNLALYEAEEARITAALAVASH
jgi:hypothetical protein